MYQVGDVLQSLSTGNVWLLVENRGPMMGVMRIGHRSSPGILQLWDYGHVYWWREGVLADATALMGESVRPFLAGAAVLVTGEIVFWVDNPYRGCPLTRIHFDPAIGSIHLPDSQRGMEEHLAALRQAGRLRQ